MGECQELADRWRAEVDRARTASLSIAEQERIMDGPEPLLCVALAANPTVHPRIQGRLAGSWLYRDLMANPNATGNVQARVAGGWDADRPAAVLRRAVVHPTAQRKIVAADRGTFVEQLAAHPSLDPAVAAAISGRWKHSTFAGLAANPTTTGKALDAYVAWPRREVRAGAAANPNLNDAALAALAGDRSMVVRRVLAANPALTPAAAQVMLGDRDRDVLIALAGNPGISEAQMADFARHPDQMVRAALAGNPRLPLSLQQALTGADRLSVVSLAANPGLHRGLQGRLAGDPDAWVRGTLAGRSDLGGDVQQALATDRGDGVRATLARNPALVVGVRRILAAQRDDEVQGAILARADADRDDLLDVLLSLVRGGGSGVNVLGSLAHSGCPEDWDRGFLDRRMTGPGAAARTGRHWVVRTALTHPDPLVRIGGLLNCLAEGGLVEDLLGDPVPEVVYAARLTVLHHM